MRAVGERGLRTASIAAIPLHAGIAACAHLATINLGHETIPVDRHRKTKVPAIALGFWVGAAID